MARLRRDLASESRTATTSIRQETPTLSPTELETSPPPTTRRRRARHIIPDDSEVEELEAITQLIPRVPVGPVKQRTQVKLAPLNAGQKPLGKFSSTKLGEKEHSLDRFTERRRVTHREISRKPKQPSPPAVDFVPSQDVEEEDVEESIWCGSASEPNEESDEELPSIRKFLKYPRRQQEPVVKPSALDLSKHMKALTIFDEVCEKKTTKTAPTRKPVSSEILNIFDDEYEDFTTTKTVRQRISQQSSEASRPGSSSDKENIAAIIRFSPPRNLKPVKSPKPLERPSTPPPPPQSPSKSRLKSPSKQRTRIPTPPHRPSLDAFWTAGAVNEWNDQYSPKKILRSPQKLLFQHSSSTTESGTPPASPSKLRSPSKAETASRKQFIARREDLARSFLAELDDVITKGRVGELAASTGGVQLVWSKTLTSTAGRANWRRETTKARDPKSINPSQVVASSEKHYATIELATKVIDDEDRLLNVLAHEFCHLANFMVSGVKDQPHGKSFKEWGAKATKAFGKRGVEVTTKHTYAIDYKYVWICGGWDGCGTEFKRHSKSIDVQRHRCGVCKGDLTQIKPVPRGGSKANTAALEPGKKSEKPVVTGYAAYVKQHFASVKKGLPPGSTHKDAMQALSKKYQAEKAATGSSSPSPAVEGDIADVVKELEAVKLGNRQSPIELD